MSSQEMLSVLESGNSSDVHNMFDQVRGASPAGAKPHQERLTKQKNASTDTD
jgi:hypothetical protein